MPIRLAGDSSQDFEFDDSELEATEFDESEYDESESESFLLSRTRESDGRPSKSAEPVQKDTELVCDSANNCPNDLNPTVAVMLPDFAR